MSGAYITHGYDMINTYKILVGKPEVKRTLGRPRRRWVEIGFREIGWEDVEWILGSSKHGIEPSGYIKGSEFLD
jgi:hypothetical protein